MSADHLYKKGNQLFLEKIKVFECRNIFLFNEGHPMINNMKIF
jgi:hypothetical protein